METTEPTFLGKIRFGAKDGCPCVPIGVGGYDGGASIFYEKQHHSFQFQPTGVQYVPNSAWRSLATSGDFFGPYTTAEGDHVGSMLGTWILDRKTGRSNRGSWFLRGGEYLVSSTPTTAEYFYHGNPDLNPFDVDRSGTIRLGTPYTIDQLNEDVQALMDSPASSVWLVPPEKSLRVRLAEIGPIRGRIEPWFDENYVDGGPCTGKVLVTEEPADFVFRQNVGGVRTFFKWSASMVRQRILVPVEGYFSTFLTTQWDLGLGPDLPRVVEPKRYWYTQPGRLQFDSPVITAEEAGLPYANIYKILNITLGDMPPSNEPVKDWPRTSGIGTC